MSRDHNAPNTPEVSPEMARRCPVCKTTFTVSNRKSRQVYCSPTCAETHRKNTPLQRNCLTCQAEFTTNASARRSYCSAECRLVARTSKDALDERVCPCCESTFQTPSTIRQVYCSPACRRDVERQRGRARDEERARRLGEIPPTAPSPRPELPPPPKPATRATSRHAPVERDPMEPTATRNCPHCQQPVTIVALLATPEAARPAIPGPGVIPLRRTP
ncbi:hypothetical protein AB0I84_40445 [Streptomyces spectabilis]|uniref:hypothetical protein n=1 Tax=Streptomyces spectabilis TaxID=68270 RepID=UPI0033CD751D